MEERNPKELTDQALQRCQEIGSDLTLDNKNVMSRGGQHEKNFLQNKANV